MYKNYNSEAQKNKSCSTASNAKPSLLKNLVCQFHEYNAKFGINYNDFIECDSCAISAECGRAFKQGYEQKIPASGNYIRLAKEFRVNVKKDKLTEAQKEILLTYLEHVDYRTGETFVSNRTIEIKTGYSYMTVKRAVKRLRQFGYFIDVGFHQSKAKIRFFTEKCYVLSDGKH